MRVWGCPSEVRIYNPQEKKLDPRTISGYFIGYAERSKGYRFYCLSHTTRIVESRNAKFLENHLTSGSDQIKNSIFVHDHIEYEPSTSSNRLVTIYNIPQVQMDVDQPIIETPQATDDPVNQVGHQDDEQLVEQQDPQENVDQTLRRSTRTRKSVIPNDYIV